MALVVELGAFQPAQLSLSRVTNAAYNHVKAQQLSAKADGTESRRGNHGVMSTIPSLISPSCLSFRCRGHGRSSEFSATNVSLKAQREVVSGFDRLFPRIAEKNKFSTGISIPQHPRSSTFNRGVDSKSRAVEESKPSGAALEVDDPDDDSVIDTPLVFTPSSTKPPNPFTRFHIAKRWAEIQGASNWQSFLRKGPIEKHLAGELIRYGEFAKATYEALDQNSDSKYCGSCKKGKERLLEYLGLENRGYTIVRYIYCTSTVDLPKFFCKPTTTPDEEKWSKDSNWMGFVAVCTDGEEIARLGRRDILVAWRGTVTYGEWIGDLETHLSPSESILQSKESKEPKVESGFWNMYTSKKEGSRYNQTSAADQVLHIVSLLIKKYQGEELSVTVTGHSLGGALAILSAHDIALKTQQGDWESPSLDRVPKANPEGITTTLPIPVTVYSFGAPRVGNNAFRDQVLASGVKALRVVNVHDIVPRVPGLLLTEAFKYLVVSAPNFVKNRSIVRYLYEVVRAWSFLKFIYHLLDQLPSTYCHLGNVLIVDNLPSCPLHCKTEPVCAHDMRSYLHLVKSNSALYSGLAEDDCRSLLRANPCLLLVHGDGGVEGSRGDEDGVCHAEPGHLTEREPEDIPENDHKLWLL